MHAPSRLLRTASAAVAALTLILGAWLFGSTITTVWESHFVGPVRDFWHLLPMLEAAERGELGLGQLIEPHGGHRLVLPRLLYLAEYTLFAGRNVLLVSCSVLLQLAWVALLARALWRERELSGGALTVFASGLVLGVAFCGSQAENLVRPLNVTYTLGMASTAAALAAAVRVGERGASPGVALLVLGAALAASLSMATALAVWPALLALGWASRWPLRTLAATAAAAGLVLASYAQGLPVRSAHASLGDLGAIGDWLLLCLGSPLSWRDTVAGRALAGAGLLLAALLSVRVLWGAREATAAERLCFGLVSFCLGGTLLVTVGRGSRFADSWQAPRYQALVLLFWLGLLLLGLLALRRARPGLRLAAMLTVAAWLLGVLLPVHGQELEKLRDFASGVRAANLAILVGVTDRSEYLHVLSHRDRRTGSDGVARHRGFLRERRLGVFASGRGDLLGRSLDAEFASAEADACRGAVTSASPVHLGAQRGLRLGGWLTATPGGHTPRLIVFSDAEHAIAGVGEPLAKRIELTGGSGLGPSPWLGYARRPDADGLRAWAVLEDGAACPLSDARGPREPQAPR